MNTIAIIGLGCRLPKSENPEAYWRLLRDGVDAVSEVPPGRWDVGALDEPTHGVLGKMNCHRGGFLEGVDQFDPYFFGIAHKEACYMDPQQRLLLEVAWEALERAGVAPHSLEGSRTGVFVGISSTDYSNLGILRPNHLSTLNAYSGTGVAHSIAANRLSYLLNLRGPSLSVDTACSSSLLAIHLACQSLRQGESDLALAGGVNLILSPEVNIVFSLAGMLSPEGRCKAFDAGADGYVRGEGCGVVVLKRHSDAVRDGDDVLAIIRGSAVNQDGRTNGLTAPSGLAQQRVIRQALENAEVSPSQISYVEAHGTGTPLGDPIEFNALSAVLSEGRGERQACGVGSVKTNIGHLEAASGIAGLIKVVLSLQHEEIPPHLHLERMNPHIGENGSRLEVITRLRPWRRRGEARFAGVSSFGFGGTNVHLVLEEAPPRPSADQEIDRPLHLLTVSAKSVNALKKTALLYEAHLAGDASASLADVCFSSNTSNSHFPHRLAVTAGSVEKLRERLEKFAADEEADGLLTGHARSRNQPKIAFLFTGQASQYPGMGAELYQSQPTFREALNKCAAVLDSRLERPLLSVLYPPADGDPSLLDETLYTQPALFALEYALSELLASWGVKPDAVLGHSVGEYVAACVAGVLSLEDALSMIAERARLMQSLPRDGVMAVVFAGEAGVAATLARHSEQVSIAAVNGPQNTVISGAREAVERALEEFQSGGIAFKRLTTSHAFHSPLMDPILDAFEEAAGRFRFSTPRIPLVSNVTGRVWEPGEIPDAKYWRAHIREAVKFKDGMDTLAQQGCGIFLELGPAPALSGMAKAYAAGRDACWLPTLKKGRSDWQVLLHNVATLYTRGVRVAWDGFDRDYRRRRVALPTYPFERSRIWFAAAPEGAAGQAQSRGGRNKSAPGGHPLLEWRLDSAHLAFETRLSLRAHPYLADHRVRQTVLLPAAAFIEMALAAAARSASGGTFGLRDVEFEKALFLGEGDERVAQVILYPDGGETCFRIYSQASTPDEQHDEWVLHATGRIHTQQGDVALNRPARVSPEEVIKRCGEEITGADYYLKLRGVGLEYGPSFQGVRGVWRRDGEALSEIVAPQAVEHEVGRYQLHPAVLDACLQTVAASTPAWGDPRGRGEVYLPVGVEKVQVFGSHGLRAWGQALFRPGADAGADTLRGDVLLFDEHGDVAARLTGVIFLRVEQASQNAAAENPDAQTYEISWQLQRRQTGPKDSERPQTSPPGTWLIFADGRGAGRALATLLTERGEKCRLIFSGEEYRRLDEHSFVINAANAEEMRRVVEAVLGEGESVYRGAIHLWGLDAEDVEEITTASLESAADLGCVSVLHLVQALAARSAQRSAGAASTRPPRLWLVTRGVKLLGVGEESVSLAQSPLWGLGRVIAQEHPELRCTNVDLSLDGGEEELQSLLEDIRAGDGEDQVALRGEGRYVPRLVRYSDGSDEPQTQPSASDPRSLDIPGDGLFRLEIPTPGILGNLTLRPLTRPDLAPGEVEIQVRAAGLNFRDVMKAMGVYPSVLGDVSWLGDECAGTITALGEGVEGFEVGEEVIAIAPACFSTYAKASAHFVTPKPAGLSFESAATVPIAFLTAYYALHHLGRISAGEKILIHAAAGGVGLAAVQMALRAGAEVFATAGSPEKREYLSSLGVKHVMDSRSLAFAEEVLELTGGKGVDLVLNSLAGEAVPRSLSVLGAYGRFLEIGKRDIYQNSKLGLRPFQNNLSFFAIDLDRIFRERPAFAGSLLREVMGLLNEGGLQPLPLRAFPVEEAVSAFRYMAQAKNIGKVVLSLPEKRSPDAFPDAPTGALHQDGTYLITGGLGGLGLLLGRWLARQGARHLVLVGRGGASAEAEETLRLLREAGVELKVARADVAREEQVAAILEEIGRTMPPLRGVIHAAGVLDDRILLQSSRDNFKSVLSPKMNGGWNLHALTLNAPLDFFVLFSSAASVFGSPGQGNYASANAFLDGLAHYRLSRGLTALSINWGPWAEVGMAARQNVQTRHASRGIGLITPAQGLEVFGRLLGGDAAQVCVMPADWRQWLRSNPGISAAPLFSLLVGEAATFAAPAGEGAEGAGRIREALFAAGPEERRRLMEAYIRRVVLAALGLEESRVSDEASLTELGLDSLTAIELKNRIETDLNIALPLGLLIDGPDITQLADRLLVLMTEHTAARSPGQLSGIEAAPSAASDQQQAEQLLTRIDDLSDAQVDSLLSEMLTEGKLPPAV